MGLNRIAYPVKSYKSGHFNIVTGTAVNTNTDGTGTLNYINEQGTSTPLAVTDRGDIRKVQVSLNGNLATQTPVRFFRTTNPTTPTSANTVYLFDVLVPVTTFSATAEYVPPVRTFDAGEFPLGPNEFLLCAIPATFANGADVIVHLNKYDE